MRTTLTVIVLGLITSVGFSQAAEENVLYVVDSIPMFEEPKEGFGTLKEQEIDRVDVLRNEADLATLGYEDLDGIYYIFTKEFVNRSDSIKAIPTTKLMTKRNGTWYLKDKTRPYSGPFIDYYINGKKQGEGILFNGRLKGKRQMYHLNGSLSAEVEYENGLANGMEKRFYEDGTLMQKGNFRIGKEDGIWEMYHPNGQLKQRSNFINGRMDGESVSYYSTGEIKGKNVYKNGIYQKDKVNDKVYDYYQQAQELYRQGNFKSAIKKYTKCVELQENWADGYFARGTARLNNLEFEEALADFNKAIEIEPYYTNAYANRAFVIIRKYEFGDSRTLSKSKDIMVVTSKEADIPESELTKICADLKKAVSLGDDNRMVLEALRKHCSE